MRLNKRKYNFYSSKFIIKYSSFRWKHYYFSLQINNLFLSNFNYHLFKNSSFFSQRVQSVSNYKFRNIQVNPEYLIILYTYIYILPSHNFNFIINRMRKWVIKINFKSLYNKIIIIPYIKNKNYYSLINKCICKICIYSYLFAISYEKETNLTKVNFF